MKIQQAIAKDFNKAVTPLYTRGYTADQEMFLIAQAKNQEGAQTILIFLDEIIEAGFRLDNFHRELQRLCQASLSRRHH